MCFIVDYGNCRSIRTYTHDIIPVAKNLLFPLIVLLPASKTSLFLLTIRVNQRLFNRRLLIKIEIIHVGEYRLS